jgi:hypothetical protein
LTGYCRPFIKNFSKIARPLSEFSKANIKPPRTYIVDKWVGECQHSFQKLKIVLSTAHLIWTFSFKMRVDKWYLSLFRHRINVTFDMFDTNLWSIHSHSERSSLFKTFPF